MLGAKPTAGRRTERLLAIGSLAEHLIAIDRRYKGLLEAANSKEEGLNETLLDHGIKTKRRLLQILGFNTSRNSVNFKLDEYLESCARTIRIQGSKNLNYGMIDYLEHLPHAKKSSRESQQQTLDAMCARTRRQHYTSGPQNKERPKE